jgi:hypothetical protein
VKQALKSQEAIDPKGHQSQNTFGLKNEKSAISTKKQGAIESKGIEAKTLSAQKNKKSATNTKKPRGYRT